MNTIPALWLPILVSSVVVFLASWIVHSVLPFHQADRKKLAGEDDVLETMRRAAVAPGDYMFPFARMSDMKDPAFQKKFEAGPVGFMTVVRGGSWGMGSSLALWFVYLLVIGVFVAYLTGRTVAPGESYLHVFRVAGASSFLAHAGAHPMMSIWYKRQWDTTVRFIVDGLVYAGLTGGVFGWLWP